MDYKKEMGLRLKERRKEMRMTQEQLSDQLNISIKHYSEVERGITGLSVENIIKISNILITILENNKYDLLILIERINNKIHLVICI